MLGKKVFCREVNPVESTTVIIAVHFDSCAVKRYTAWFGQHQCRSFITSKTKLGPHYNWFCVNTANEKMLVNKSLIISSNA